MAKHLGGLAWLACVVVLSSTALAACGDDDGGGSKPEPDSGMPLAGTGGSGGMGGSGGTGGTGGSTATSVPCGSTTCSAPPDPTMGLGAMFGLGAPKACCVDEAMGTCGVMNMMTAMCAEPPPPPTPDPSCPGVALGAMAMVGCCVDGQCGVDGTVFGMGCVENASAAQQIMAIPLIGGFIMIPPPQACSASGDDGGTDSDGGN